MKAILVPTDFSESSAAAYSYAAMLAEKTDSTIYLLHILEISIPSLSLGGDKETTDDTPFMIELMKITKARMKKVREGKEFKGLDVKEIIEVGPVPERIFNAVKTNKIDMIVMGTHGVNGFQERFIGTNAEKVVRNSEVPVLSAKYSVKKVKVDAIIFATDFSKETEQVLPLVSEYAELFKARLVLVKVVVPGNFETSVETEKRIEKFRDKSDMYNYSTDVCYANSKEEGIVYAAESSGAGLIALGTHGRHGLARLFRSSVAEDVVSHVSLPVLTINLSQKRSNSKFPAREKKARQFKPDFSLQIPSL